MLTYNILETWLLFLKDDDARFTKEVEILDDAKVTAMLDHLYKFGKNTNSTKYICYLLFDVLFGLRASELSALKNRCCGSEE